MVLNSKTLFKRTGNDRSRNISYFTRHTRQKRLRLTRVELGKVTHSRLQRTAMKYLENYDALAERLAELHTFATLPSVLLIDDFDAYTNDHNRADMPQDIHIARTCSMILDTMNSCARILKKTVYVCAWSYSGLNDISTYAIYFFNIWNVTEEEEGKAILLQKYSQEYPTEECPSYRYCKLEDGTRVLKQILYESLEN
ncbi:unnamed protein product [Xylocopa violacea]|uniref:ATPase AAA-type core domain-containing protein n=1 Tax=Xylocopa violacea TaxID=135666 RepID=A0ABP1N6H4_XYLVO